MSFPGIYDVTIFDCPPFQMVSFNDSHRAVEILELGRFEPTSMALWCKLARKASRIIDIGAQEGIYALAAAALRKDVQIDAFEPNPDAYARMAVHKQINGFENITLHREAVAALACVWKISWTVKGPLISSGGSLSDPREGQDSAMCRVARLDRLLAPADFALIKIDVEGAEELVLKGMDNHLCRGPDILLETFDQHACDAWNAAIAPLGYNVWKIYETDGRIEPVPRLTPCDRDSRNFNHFLSVGGLP